MQLKSVFENGEKIPEKYTCDGENINPPLKFLDVPKQTKSLALILDDPDSPAGTFTHWTVWNIMPDVTSMNEDVVSELSVLGKTSFGKVGYGGPCPSTGEHRYVFKLFALDIMIDLAQGAEISKLKKAIEGHVIDQVELVGKYQRKN